MWSCLIQTCGTKFCSDLLFDWLFPLSPPPSCTSNSVGCLAVPFFPWFFWTSERSLACSLHFGSREREQVGEERQRKYEALWNRNRAKITILQAFPILHQASQARKKTQHNSLGPQLSGKDVFHWTRRITECPKLWHYTGFCITLPDNSPRSLCKYSHEWKLPTYFAGICNSFYSRRLFLAETAHTKGE